MAKLTQFIKFEPILKEKIWGGEKLMTLFNKKSNRNDIGESWEVSDVDGDTSIVSNGALKGYSLKDLITSFKHELVGEKVFQMFQEKFPLLIKFIDAKEKLSIQLHPNDALAKERHNSFGKTEMWYIMHAEEASNIIVGFKNDTSKQQYLEHLTNKTLLEILNVDTVNEGDVYFIPTGRIHAIGSGVLLAEIQQTSDNTYRVYDWDRKDAQGNTRELHTEEAIDAIDFTAQSSYKTSYQKVKNTASNIVTCPYFTTNIIEVDQGISLDHTDKDSFVIYMCVKGCVQFHYKDITETIEIGQTLLVPACFKKMTIEVTEPSELLEVFIK